MLLILGTTNAVNLTDGLDGLAAGSATFAFAAYVVIGFWAFRHPGCTSVAHALDLAVVAAAMLGALHRLPVVERRPGPHLHGRHRVAGHRRRAGRPGASRRNTHLLLPIIGGLFVFETLSVILQVGSFRLSPAGASSAWRRSTTTSSWPAGPRPP